MAAPLLAIGPAPLALETLVRAVGGNAGADGAVVTFSRPGPQPQPGSARPIPRIRGVRTARAAGLRANLGGGCGALAGRSAGHAPSHRPSRHRRRQRRDRHGVPPTAPMRSPRAVTRSSGSSRLRRSGSTSSSRAATSGSRVRRPIPTTNAPGPRRSESHARDGAAVRPAARYRRHGGAGSRGRSRRDDRVDLAAAGDRACPSWPATSVRSRRAVNADYARMDHQLHDGDEVAFLPPVSGG